MNNKVKSITEFHKLTSELKTTERSGWKDWGVTGRLESVAEHSFGSPMLAYAIWENYKDKYPNVKIERVISMLVFHEMDEILMPDYTPFSKITKEEKRELGKQAVEQVASVLPESDYMRALIEEFEQGQTPDAKFAKMVDSLEAGLQSQIYDEKGQIDLENPKAKDMIISHDLHGRGHDNLSDSWLAFCTERYGYDETFKDIANQAQATRSGKLQRLTNVLQQVAEKKDLHP